MNLSEHWDRSLAVIFLWVAGIFEAADQGLKSSPRVAENAPAFVEGGLWHLLPLLFLMGAAVMWAIGKVRKPQLLSASIVSQASQSSGGIIPGIPTLSSLVGQNPSANFDAKQFFALSHYSPITAEVEKNIKLAAMQNSPSDKEAFYARFIGVGVVAYFHDVTWYTIYGSQLECLGELNSKGVVPLAVVRAHYDAVVPKFPALYPKYTFDDWLHYMQDRMLVVRYPTDMVDITHHGKDFLKYLTHIGRNIHGKAF